MRRTLLLALLVVPVMLTAAPASAGAGGGGLCDAFGDGNAVTMLDNCFSGTAQFVDAGEPLRVVNDGEMAHTYTAVDGSFDTGQLAPGASAELTLEPGIHRVYCTLHASVDEPGSGMAGVVLVGVNDGEPAAVTAATAQGSGGSSLGYATPLAALALIVSVTALLVRRRRIAPTSG